MTAADHDYRRAGFCRLPALLDEARLQALRADVVAAFPVTSPRPPYGILSHNPWRRLPSFAALLAEGGIGRRLCALLDVPSLRLFQDNLVWKPPGTTDAIAWHQDYAYWPLTSPAGVTLWLALDDADADNGCVRYLPGSHHAGECAPAEFVAGAGRTTTSHLPVLDLAGREADVVEVTVRAGDAIVHHPLVWHGSGGNGSTRQRRAWSLSFVAADACWDPSHAPHPYNHLLAPQPGAPVEGELFPLFER